MLSPTIGVGLLTRHSSQAQALRLKGLKSCGVRLAAATAIVSAYCMTAERSCHSVSLHLAPGRTCNRMDLWRNWREGEVAKNKGLRWSLVDTRRHHVSNPSIYISLELSNVS